MGASSASSRPIFSSSSSSPPVTSRASRSTSPSSVSADIWLSTCSIALSSAFWSLSSSTMIASIARLVWNLISSMACMFVGSATARNSRLPRRNTGRTRCLASSLSLTRRTVSRSRFSASRSNNGTPNSFEAATAMSRAFAAPLDTNWVTTLALRSRAALIASSMARSSTTPSCPRR